MGHISLQPLAFVFHHFCTGKCTGSIHHYFGREDIILGDPNCQNSFCKFVEGSSFIYDMVGSSLCVRFIFKKKNFSNQLAKFRWSTRCDSDTSLKEE